MSVINQINGLQRVLRNIDLMPEFIIRQVLISNEAVIVEMCSKDQLYERGVDIHGNKIEPEYAPFTVSVKRDKNAITDHVTLFDTGDLYDSLYVSVSSDSFTIQGTDWKYEKLERAYGDVFGLTDENARDLFDNYVIPAIWEYWYKTLKDKGYVD